jgi:N-acetylmuramic acid 6-phosphate etherase
VAYSGLYHFSGVGAVFIIGIDGGGTSTDLWLTTVQGEIRAIVAGSGSNVRTLGSAATIGRLDDWLDLLLREAGAEDRSVAAAVVGLAGIGRREERDPLETWLHRRFPGRPTALVTDVELVLAAGTPQGTGIAVVSGTGSIAFGRDGLGFTARAGGGGAGLGDPGSGYAIGRAALGAVVQAAEYGGPGTRLVDALAAEAPSVMAADPARPPLDPADIAGICPIVADVAAAGDPIAAAILEAAGADLARQASVALEELTWPDHAVPAAFAGGVLVHIEPVRATLVRGLGRLGWPVSPVTIVEQPVRGAIGLAAALVGQAVRLP